ncbi:MAG: hypothetical protein K8F91_21860 [Candidatus Obscuribacterales bacterium]|nr:hypothetical protein [Candidatus Obscuribacterales bacterium]
MKGLRINRKTDTIVPALVSVSIILAISITAAFLMAYTWEGVCFLRSYGVETRIIDKSILILDKRNFHNTALNTVANALDFYNTSFPNNMRFGSGLGLVAGPFLALLLLCRLTTRAWSTRTVRLIAGLTAGAIVGGRLDLMFNSDPLPFLVAVLCFSVITGILAAQSGNKLPHLRDLEQF